MLPYPMPGKLSYFFTPPACYYAWGSLVILGISAVGGLLLQNAALGAETTKFLREAKVLIVGLRGAGVERRGA